MGNIFAGLAFFITGITIWFVSSLGKGISDAVKFSSSSPNFYMKLGFIFMIGGPALFWVIRPIYRLKKERKGIFLNILFYSILAITIIFVIMVIGL
ncbi:MAG: hypothetical protein A2W19_16585 [Spirochaetes bacterium RBG_16_49_21]|nr:MAG: hypothetical protein A2W19_16585 [Spirochaetes bacterium RBG_16_49_21]